MTHLSGDTLLEALEAADVAPAQLLQDAGLVERMAWASRTWLVELLGLGTCQVMVLSCGFAITTALEPKLQEFIVAVPGDGVPSDTWVPLDDGSGAASVEIGVRFFVLPGAASSTLHQSVPSSVPVRVFDGDAALWPAHTTLLAAVAERLTNTLVADVLGPGLIVFYLEGAELEDEFFSAEEAGEDVWLPAPPQGMMLSGPRRPAGQVPGTVPDAATSIAALLDATAEPDGAGEDEAAATEGDLPRARGRRVLGSVAEAGLPAQAKSKMRAAGAAAGSARLA